LKKDPTAATNFYVTSRGVLVKRDINF